MKNSTTFAICSIASAIWVMATVYAVAFNRMGINSFIEWFMVITPFISFVLCIVLHNMEMRKELKEHN